MIASVFNCPEETKVGLYSIDKNQNVTWIDNLPTTGICRGPYGELVRLVWKINKPTPLVINDQVVELPISHAHDIYYDDVLDLYTIVATHTNEIYWVDSSGNILDTWQATTVPDAWHLSGVWGRYVSAFGRYNIERGWYGNPGHGIIFDILTGRDIIDNLYCPHSPTIIDNILWYCESWLGLVVAGTKKLELDGWTRGIIRENNVVYVGVSAKRKAGERRQTQQPYIAVIDLDSFKEIDRIYLPGLGDIFTFTWGEE